MFSKRKQLSFQVVQILHQSLLNFKLETDDLGFNTEKYLLSNTTYTNQQIW